MYTLYHFPISCSSAVKIALELIGDEHRTNIVNLYEGEQRHASFLAINPKGKVPVLVEGNDVFTQGEAILVHLSQKHPDAELMPDLSSRNGMLALQWLNFFATSLHGHFSHIFHPEKVSTDPEIVKCNAEEEIVKLLNIVEEQLKLNDFIATENPTLADYYFAVILGWGKVLSFDLFDRYPLFLSYKKRLQAAKPESETLQSL